MKKDAHPEWRLLLSAPTGPGFVA